MSSIGGVVPIPADVQAAAGRGWQKVGISHRLDLMVSEVFSSLNGSVILMGFVISLKLVPLVPTKV